MRRRAFDGCSLFSILDLEHSFVTFQAYLVERAKLKIYHVE